MAIWSSLRGVLGNLFGIGGQGGVNVKHAAGTLEVRNAADAAYARMLAGDPVGDPLGAGAAELVANGWLGPRCLGAGFVFGNGSLGDLSFVDPATLNVVAPRGIGFRQTTVGGHAAGGLFRIDTRIIPLHEAFVEAQPTIPFPLAGKMWVAERTSTSQVTVRIWDANGNPFSQNFTVYLHGNPAVWPSAFAP